MTAFALQQQVVGNTAAALNTPQISITSVAGEHLVAVFGRSGGLSSGALSSVTDSAGNTWVLATRGNVSGGTNTRVEIWYSLAAASVTWVQGNSSASQVYSWNVQRYTGPSDAAIDVVSTDGSGVVTAGTSLATPSVTTTGTGDLVIAGLHCPIGGTLSLTGGGFTALTESDDATGATVAGYQIGNAGSYAATWTNTSSVKAGTFTVAFKGTTTSGFTQSPTDTAGSTDANALSVSQAPVDTAGSTDSATVSKVLSQVSTDTAGSTDSAAIGPAPTDTAGSTDSSALAVSQAPADTAGSTDASALSVSQAPVDTAGSTDSATVSKILSQAPADTAGSTDSAVVTYTAGIASSASPRTVAVGAQVRTSTHRGESRKAAVPAGSRIFTMTGVDGGS